MEEPVYLIFEDLLELYAAIIGGTAPQAADQLRSRHALEDYRVRASDPELGEWIISLSRGATPEALAEILRDRLDEITPRA